MARPTVVVGVHVLGEDAGEMAQLLAIAIRLGAKKADFDDTIAVHPTSAEELVTMRVRTARHERMTVGPKAPDAMPMGEGAEAKGRDSDFWALRDNCSIILDRIEPASPIMPAMRRMAKCDRGRSSIFALNRRRTSIAQSGEPWRHVRKNRQRHLRKIPPRLPAAAADLRAAGLGATARAGASFPPPSSPSSPSSSMYSRVSVASERCNGRSERFDLYRQASARRVAQCIATQGAKRALLALRWEMPKKLSGRGSDGHEKRVANVDRRMPDAL